MSRRIISNLKNFLLGPGSSTEGGAAEASFRTNDRWFKPITRREAGWLVVGSLAFALAFSYPILGDLVYQGPGVSRWISAGPVFGHLTRFPANGDWDETIALRWVPYQTITHFLEFPFWNPYKCGGMPMLGNPEGMFATPFLLVDLATGLVAGVYLQIILHIALGFAGAYVLARVMGMGVIPGLVLASVFLSCSWPYLQLAMGNLQISLPVAYWPWILALFFIGIDRRKIAPLAVGGMMLALTATEGNYTFVYAGILVGVVSLTIALTQQSIRPVIATVVLAVFGVTIGAIKLLPVAEFLALFPRTPGLGCLNPTLSMIPTFLFSRNQDLYREIANTGVYACYSAYVSPTFALLAVIGLLSGRLKTLPWLVAAIVFLLLALGDYGPYSAFALLLRLPLCSNISFPDALPVSIRVCGWRAGSLWRGFRLPQRRTMGSSRSLRTSCYRSCRRMVGGPTQSQIPISRPCSGGVVSLSSVSAVLVRQQPVDDSVQYGESWCGELLWHGEYLVKRDGIQPGELLGRVLRRRTRQSYSDRMES